MAIPLVHPVLKIVPSAQTYCCAPNATRAISYQTTIPAPPVIQTVQTVLYLPLTVPLVNPKDKPSLITSVCHA